MTLKAKKPENIEKRLKLFLFGEYGVGKTVAALSFPNAYIFDTERGAENNTYVEQMKKNNSVIMQTNDSDEIISELRSLISEKHDYKTIVLDPITTLETDLLDKAQKKYTGDNDMRVWRDRDQVLRRISNLLLKADMNVVVTAHGKVEWGQNMAKIGTTFDGWKRWPFLFDLVIELKRVGDKRVGMVRKTRVDTFKDSEVFDWSYDEFQKRYGEKIEKKAEAKELASKAQVKEIERLVTLLKIDDDIVNKWMSKAQADSWDEFPSESLEKCIDYCNKLIKGKKE